MDKKKKIAQKMSSRKIRRFNERGNHLRVNSEGSDSTTKSILRHVQKGVKHGSAFAKGRMDEDGGMFMNPPNEWHN